MMKNGITQIGMMLCTLICALFSLFVQAEKSVKPEINFNQKTMGPFLLTTINNELTQPWGMDFLPGKKLLVTEKAGDIKLIDLTTGTLKDISGSKPESVVQGQGGLLDLAIDPDFKTNPWVYFSYAAKGEGGFGTEVGRAMLKENRLINFETLFVATPKKSSRYHFGSRLVFDDKKLLYISLGDRGDRHEAQNSNNHIGTIVRINRDGSIPKNNPFVTDKSIPDEIYSYGHRNVQGIVFDEENKRLWATEHGPQGGDELNIIKPGLNYGWPKITYGKEYGSGRSIGDGVTAKNIEAPLWQWTPSIAPSGLAIYRGDMFPAWKGNILAGALKYQLIARMSYNGKSVAEEERLFEQDLGRIRDVAVDEEGAVYVLIDSSKSEILKITPVNKINP